MAKLGTRKFFPTGTELASGRHVAVLVTDTPVGKLTRTTGDVRSFTYQNKYIRSIVIMIHFLYMILYYRIYDCDFSVIRYFVNISSAIIRYLIIEYIYTYIRY